MSEADDQFDPAPDDDGSVGRKDKIVRRQDWPEPVIIDGRRVRDLRYLATVEPEDEDDSGNAPTETDLENPPPEDSSPADVSNNAVNALAPAASPDVAISSNGSTVRVRQRPQTPSLPAEGVGRDDVSSDVSPVATVPEDSEATDASSMPADPVKKKRVGKYFPPEEMRFQKGVSGNPRGRPSGSKSATTIARNAVSERRTLTINGVTKKWTLLEIAFHQQANKAAKGDTKALNFLLPYLPGGVAGRNDTSDQAEPVMPFLDQTDIEMLADETRRRLHAEGLGEAQIDTVLSAMGLKTKKL